MKDYISNRLMKYIENNIKIKNKSVLVVVKGIKVDILKKIKLEKLLSTELEISIQELKKLKGQLLIETISRFQQSTLDIFWCTYEEYLVLDNEILSMYYDIRILKNNLYEKQFPCIYKIDNIEIIEQFLDIDQNIDDEIQNNDNIDIFTEFYGE